MLAHKFPDPYVDILKHFASSGFADAVDEADADSALAWPADAPKVGDIVWLQPGHIDPTVNLYDALCVVDEDGAVETWPIDARRTAF